MMDHVSATYTSLIQQYLGVLMYDAAAFYAERLLAHTGGGGGTSGDPHAVHLLATCYYRNNEPRRARAVLRDSMAGSSIGAVGADVASSSSSWSCSAPPASRYLLARCCHDLGLHGEAEKALIAGTAVRTRGLDACADEIISTNPCPVPNGAAGLHLLGDICRKTHRGRQACLYYKLALRLDPMMWSAFENLCELGDEELDVQEVFGVSNPCKQRQPPPPAVMDRISEEGVHRNHHHQRVHNQQRQEEAAASAPYGPASSPLFGKSMMNMSDSVPDISRDGASFATPPGGHGGGISGNGRADMGHAHDAIMAARASITARKGASHSALWNAGASSVPRENGGVEVGVRGMTGRSMASGSSPSALFNTPNLTPIQAVNDTLNNASAILPGGGGGGASARQTSGITGVSSVTAAAGTNAPRTSTAGIISHSAITRAAMGHPSTTQRQQQSASKAAPTPRSVSSKQALHAARQVAARLYYETSPEHKPPYTSSVSSDFAYCTNAQHANDGDVHGSSSNIHLNESLRKTPRIRRVGVMQYSDPHECYVNVGTAETSNDDDEGMNRTGVSSRLSFSSLHSSESTSAAGTAVASVGAGGTGARGGRGYRDGDPVTAARTAVDDAAACPSSIHASGFMSSPAANSSFHNVGKRVLFQSGTKEPSDSPMGVSDGTRSTNPVFGGTVVPAPAATTLCLGRLGAGDGSERSAMPETSSAAASNMEVSEPQLEEEVQEPGNGDRDGQGGSGNEDPVIHQDGETYEDNQEEAAIAASHGTAEYRGVRAVLNLLAALGAAYQHLCQYRCREALDVFAAAVPSDQRHTGWVQHQIGRAYFEMADYTNAKKSLELMQSIEPHRLRGLEVLSTTLWHLKREVDLCNLAQRAVEMDRLAPECWCVVGNCFSLQKEHETALAFFRRSIQLDASFTYSYTLSGHEYVSNEDFEKAVGCFRAAIRVDERHYNAWYGLGAIYFRQEKYELAEYHFRRALGINPQSSVLHCHLGMVQHANAKPYEALETLQRAFVLDPANPQARYQRATILISLQRYEEALSELEKVRDTAPKESSVHFTMGKVCKRLGDTEGAMRCFLTALDLDPKDNNLIKAAIDRLDEPDVDEDVSAF